jgi:zinc protease
MLNRLAPLFLLLTLTACGEHPDPVAESSEPAANAKPVETGSAAPELPSGVTLVETYDGSDGEFTLPFSKYRLDNGLTVVLHEDHSDPLVHIDVTYHVGSNREEPGRSGFAHLFEHMMFEGSANVADGDHGKIISNAGGTMNGSTNSDLTNYYETLPINQLEIALWLEADRMGFLLEAVDQEKFDVQRETVKNERGQRIDNVPYGRWNETAMAALYPPGHPYSWPVIGWTEDLNAAGLGDLKRFFLRWYGPNNATVTIGGDIDPQQTLEWISRYFGPIPSGPAVENLPKQPAVLDDNRYLTMEDNVHLPAIAMLIPTVHVLHPDEAPLDAAAKILGQGRASLLYQRLVQSGRAVSAFVAHSCRELSCEMAFIVVQNPQSGETLAEMEEAVRETLREFAERGVNADDLQKFKAGFESRQVFGMQSVTGKVGALAISELFTGDPRNATRDIERYNAVTEADVTRAFKQYIEDQPAVILSITPKGQAELAARAQNYQLPPRRPGSQTEDDRPSVSPAVPEQEPKLRSVQDNFDRSAQPEPGVNPSTGLPPIWDTTLANGVRMLAVPNIETPTVTIQAVFEMGKRDEPPGKAGLASLTAALMREATTERSAAEFSEALERIGATVSVGSGPYQTSVSVNTLARHLDEAVELMMERMLKPDFTEEDFERVKSQRMESILQSRKSGPALAGRALDSVLMGPTHPMSYPGLGLASTLEAVSLDDIKAFYDAHIPGHLMAVLVSSSLPQADIERATAALGALEVSEAFREAAQELPPVEQHTIYLVNKEEAAQSSLRIGRRSLKYDALGDYYLAGLMNFNLGGTFASRINLNLREDKGYTYGISSGFSGGPEHGRFVVSGEVNKESTAASINETLNELRAYRSGGMTEEEFDYMQSAIGQRDALRYETPGAKLGLLSRVVRYDLPLDYRQQQRSLLKETDRETLNALAGELVDAENLAIVVVGDETVIRPQLEELGMPIKVLNEDGFEM